MKTHTTVIRFTLLAGLAACGNPAPAPQAPGNDTATAPGGGAAEANVPAGVAEGALWTCQIEDYDAQPCKFHKEADGWHLSKLMGSQRFTGTVTFTAEGMALVGEFFCPWGDCTAKIDTTLAAEGSTYSGALDGSPVKVWWDESLAGEWGGAGYGNRTGREIE